MLVIKPLGKILINCNKIIILLALLPNYANAIDEIEFAKLILNHKQLHEASILQIKIKELDLQEKYQKYGDWTWTLDATVSKQQLITDKDHVTSYDNQNIKTTRTLSTNLSKKFFSTGAELKLSVAKSNPSAITEKTTTNTLTIPSSIAESTTNEYKNSAAISLTVPLLKNLGGIIDQKTYHTAELDLNNKKLTAKYRQEQILYKNLVSFLKWGWLEKKTYILNRRLSMAQKTLTRAKNSNNHKKNILFAQNSFDKTLLQLITTKATLQSVYSKIVIKFGNNILKQKPKIDWNKKINLLPNPRQHLQQHSILLQKIAVGQQINQVNISAYRNTKNPQLDLIFSANRSEYLGNKYTTYTYSNQNDYKVELKFSFPLFGNVSNNINLAKAQIRMRQLQLKHNERLAKVLTQLNDITNKIKLNSQKIELYQQQKINAQKVANSEVRNYYDGRIDIRDLLRSQDAWVKIALGQAKLLFNYRKDSLKYDILLNRLLSKYQITQETE